MGPTLLVIAALVGCTAPQARDRVSPELAEQLDAARTTDVLRVLVVGEGDPVSDAGATVVHAYDNVPVTLADVTPDQAWALADSGAAVGLDAEIFSTGRSGGNSGAVLSSDVDLIRRSVGADRVQAGASGVRASGRGVVVALIDSGLDTRHGDLPRNFVVAHRDFVDEGEDDLEDPYGHGTMVAGVLAGTRTGAQGVAPGVRVVAARVLDEDGAGKSSDAIAALDWILDERDETGVRVINLSIGAPATTSFTIDPLAAAVEVAVREGIVVVAAAGNYGMSDGSTVYGGITSPANDPLVITVGAVDSRGTARRSDDVVASFSSRGPTLFDGLGKPDIAAPGQMLALNTSKDGALWDDNPGARLTSWDGVKLGGARYVVASGTSFASPMVAGTVALMLEVNPELTPTEVKALLEITASDLGDASLLGQGAGELDALGAVRLAKWWGSSAPVPVMTDTLSGETVVWSDRVLWDGYDTTGADLSVLNNGDVLAVGDIDGNGILWDGSTTQYVGIRVSGRGLLDPTLPAWGSLWGQGILWDGGLNVSSGRVWSAPTLWRPLVWPDNLTAAGSTSPLFVIEPLTGLTTPVAGAQSPVPPTPVF